MYDVARLLRSIAVISAITASNPWTSVKRTTSCTRVHSYIVYLLSISLSDDHLKSFFSHLESELGLLGPNCLSHPACQQCSSDSKPRHRVHFGLQFWSCCSDIAVLMVNVLVLYRTQLLSWNLWFNSWWRLLHEVVEPTNRWHDQLHPTTLWRQATTETTSCVLYVTNDPLWFETRSLHGRQRWTAFLQHVKYCKYAERSSGYFCVESDLWVCSYSSMLKVLRLRFVLCGDEES